MKVNREQSSWQRVKRSDDDGELFISGNRANSLDNQGKYQEALKIYEEINQRFREDGREDHPDILVIRSNMALVLDHQGKYQEALKILEEVYQKQQEILPLDSLFTLSTRNDIALVLKHQGKYRKALEAYTEVYEKRKTILGEDDSSTLETKVSIAMVLDKQGKYQKALEILEEVYQKQKDPEQKDPDVLNNKALVLQHQGKRRGSLEAFEKAYKKRKEILGESHQKTLRAGANLALELSKLGRYDEALMNLEEVLQKQEETLGENHPDTLMTIDNKGFILLHQGDYSEALQTFQKNFDKRISAFGLNHPQTLQTGHNIASTLFEQGKYNEALESFTAVFNKRAGTLGPEHPETLNVKHNMAVVLAKQGKYEEASWVYENVLNTQRIVLGQEHPDTLRTRYNIATVLKDRGKYDEALQVFTEVFDVQKNPEILGPEHPETLRTNSDMASVLKKQGKYNESLLIYKDVYQKQREILGQDHPDTLATESNIASLEGKIHSFSAACLTGNRKKRDTNNCQFLWEDIDQFNEEKDESRNPNKIKINSGKFIPYIKDINENKRIQLVQLAGQVEVTGKLKDQVNELINNQKIVSHLSKVERVSRMAMYGMMGKATLAAFLNGDENGVAINLGFIAGGQGFAKVAEAASIKGARLVLDGKLLLGRSLKAASPFLSRVTSAFIAYDLVNQVKEYKKGNNDALVAVVGDSVYLGADLVEIGVEIAEVFEILEGVSSITGPIGATIGAVVFVGTDIYLAIKRVDRINEIIHLTGMEKFIEGLRAFIGMKPETCIEELMDEKQINNQLIKQGIEYLKQHSDIRRYVFPAGKLVVDSCRSVPHNATICISGEFPCSIGMHTVTSYVEKCTTKFQEDQNNIVLFDRKKIYSTFSRAKIGNPDGGEVLCSSAKHLQMSVTDVSELISMSDFLGIPYETMFNGALNRLVSEGYERMHKAAYFCGNAMGVENSVNRTGNYTLINLDDGYDYAKGFLDSQNIFVLGNGQKHVVGGDKSNIFILRGNVTTGYINGGSGIDTIDLSKFSQREQYVLIDLSGGHIWYGGNAIRVANINRVLARNGRKDEINCAYDTEYVDGKGGENSNAKDIINIPALNHTYKMQLIIRPNTVIHNNASVGNFSYVLPIQEGEAFVNLPKNSESNHKFILNYTLSDISDISHFGTQNVRATTFSFLPFNFNLTTIYNMQSSTAYLFSDNAEIKIDNQKNVHALQKVNVTIYEIINDYSAMANRLKMSIFVRSMLNNETAAIGHGNHDVLHNNPHYKSHLVGNGGENIFVITSGYEMLDEGKLPIPEVTIYDLDTENLIDTLDLRQINRQIVNDLNGKTGTETKVEGRDLLLLIYYDQVDRISEILSRIIRHDVVCIRLKEALVTNWHERLQVIINNAPMKIEEFNLKPLPLIFDEDKEIIVIKPQDIEKENKLVISKKAENYTFARSENDLIITNAFDNNLTNEEFCTVALKDFYREAKMQTLVIKFAEREIVLKDEMEKINNAATLEEQRDQHKNATYSAVFNDYVSSTQRKRRKVKGYEDQEFFYAQNNASTGLKEERVTNSGSRQSSWISGFAQWVKGSVGQWFNQQAVIDEVFYAQNNANHSIPEIESSKSNVALPKIDNSTLILADLATRLYMKESYKSPISALSKDRILEDKMDGIEKSIKRAVSNDYSKIAPDQEPRTDFKNVSIEKAIKNRGRESV